MTLPAKVTITIPFSVNQRDNLFSVGFAAAWMPIVLNGKQYIPDYDKQMLHDLATAIRDKVNEDELNSDFIGSLPDYTTMVKFFALYKNPEFKYSSIKSTLTIIATLPKD